ncbi:hypothetical protein BJY01DRAFT_236580 [Aspergillus pseudoustus]|uniref:Geranylgeranyl pyrophosphate synthetase n=1 Tax=Aspergillus pseudoustus TaxID=1810923 RepID=A0ABR4JLH1_9EURO
MSSMYPEAGLRLLRYSRLIKGDTLAPTSISDVKNLCSYRWIESRVPIIAVPDSGPFYIAQNAARHPDSPLEPLFRALYTNRPSFDIHSVDLVSDRNNIWKLMSFVNPSLERDKLEVFTIEVEVTQDTSIFCRVETATFEVIGPNMFKGYRSEFEEAYATEIVENGGMRILLRYETDGYIQSPVEDNEEASSMPEPHRLLSSKPPYAASDQSALMIKEEGRQAVAPDSILEIKTLSQTLNLVRAYHNHGLFDYPNVETVADKLIEWEESHHADLAKLTALIKTIISVVKENGGKAFVRYNEERDKLAVWKDDNRKKLLPDDLYARFEKGECCLA